MALSTHQKCKKKSSLTTRNEPSKPSHPPWINASMITHLPSTPFRSVKLIVTIICPWFVFDKDHYALWQLQLAGKTFPKIQTWYHVWYKRYSPKKTHARELHSISPEQTSKRRSALGLQQIQGMSSWGALGLKRAEITTKTSGFSLCTLIVQLAHPKTFW